jgi:hypothetical protein
MKPGLRTILETMIVDDVPDEGGGEGVKNRKIKKGLSKR